MSWLQKDSISYHAKLGLQDKGCAVKGLVVCRTIGSVIFHFKSMFWFRDTSQKDMMFFFDSQRLSWNIDFRVLIADI